MSKRMQQILFWCCLNAAMYVVTMMYIFWDYTPPALIRAFITVGFWILIAATVDVIYTKNENNS